MVSVGISKLGCTDLVFFDPGVKINSAYYCDVLLSKQLLPVMCEVLGEFSFFNRTTPQNTGTRQCATLEQRWRSSRSLASEQP